MNDVKMILQNPVVSEEATVDTGLDKWLTSYARMKTCHQQYETHLNKGMWEKAVKWRDSMIEKLDASGLNAWKAEQLPTECNTCQS